MVSQEPKKPLAIDLFCGLGGWTDGLLAEGWRVVGFDIERHEYGEHRYPARLVLQDVTTIHGSQFKDARLILASPPCQEFSYMAMPWSLAKEKQRRIEADPEEQKRLTALFDACFRIQREAEAAAGGRHIPLIVENVRGAQKWVGRAKWNFGSFYLWGDVPALMPIIAKRQVMKAGITHRTDGSTSFHGQKAEVGSCARLPGAKGGRISGWPHASADDGIKTPGRNLSKDSERKFGTHNMGAAASIYAELDIKQGGDWFNASQPSISRRCGGKSRARKAASAMIAKIPELLARHIGRVYFPA